MHGSRCHVVNEFNRGIYDYIIATDEVGISRGGSAAQAERSGTSKGKSRKRKRDMEYGVARGIDFQGQSQDIADLSVCVLCALRLFTKCCTVFVSGVENVINFDCPPSADAYIHRVGRYSAGTGG